MPSVSIFNPISNHTHMIGPSCQVSAGCFVPLPILHTKFDLRDGHDSDEAPGNDTALKISV